MVNYSLFLSSKIKTNWKGNKTKRQKQKTTIAIRRTPIHTHGVVCLVSNTQTWTVLQFTILHSFSSALTALAYSTRLAVRFTFPCSLTYSQRQPKLVFAPHSLTHRAIIIPMRWSDRFFSLTIAITENCCSLVLCVVVLTLTRWNAGRRSVAVACRCWVWYSARYLSEKLVTSRTYQL